MQLHTRNKTLSKKTNEPYFSLEEYCQSISKTQYIQQLLSRYLRYHRLPEKMTLDQFSNLLGVLPIKLKNKQLHEVYIYSSFSSSNQPQKKQKGNSKQMPIAQIFLPNKINLHQVSKWIVSKIPLKRFQGSNTKAGRLSSKSMISENYIKTERNDKTSKNRDNRTNKYNDTDRNSKTDRLALPLIKTRPEDRFKSQLSNILSIFSQIQKVRQDAGLQPVCLSQDEQDQQQTHDIPNKQVHYDGDFFQVNQNINKLKAQAERRITQIVQAAREDPVLRDKFQRALVRYQKVRSQTNQQLGRCGAMKAHKRMIQRRRLEIEKLDKWKDGIVGVSGMGSNM